MGVIHAVGVDAAFANMGFARVRIDLEPSGPVVRCLGLELVSTEGMDRKTVRKSSDELRRAKELQSAMTRFCAGASLVFVEVPSGSQSASAARSLGIAVGILASCQQPIVEVSPMEVKRAVVTNPKVKVSKADVIKWALERWPSAPWLRDRGKPDGRILNSNEHLADALASVMAGIATPEFQRLIMMTTQNETTGTPNFRPASNRRTIHGL